MVQFNWKWQSICSVDYTPFHGILCGGEQVVKQKFRMVVKVGSSSITDDAGQLSMTKLQAFTSQIAHLHDEEHVQMVLVSSGAVALGMAELGWRRRESTMPEKQGAAAVGQGRLIQAYQQLFAKNRIQIAQLLLTRADIEDRRRFVNIRNTMETLLHHGVIPIINENDTVAVDEIRFGDNDTLSSFVAMVADADMLVLLTDVDGLYTANPREDSSARKLDDVFAIDAAIESMAGDQGSEVGTGGMRTKISAAKIATQSGIDVLLANSESPDVLLRIWRRERVGTRFHAQTDPMNAKKSWMLFGPRPDGELIVDKGAVTALLKGNGSLLLPGIREVRGDFQEGAVVGIVQENGEEIAKGICNFSAWDLRVLIARKQDGESLRNLQEAIHRNQMVLSK